MKTKEGLEKDIIEISMKIHREFPELSKYISEMPVKNIDEKNFEEDMTGEDLDIPGVELDDQQENVGSEDEENNYYSIGGDEYGDLDENNS